MSKTISKEYVVYHYDELSDTAKEKVKEFYLDNQALSTHIFTEDCDFIIQDRFPNSNLTVEYDLFYSQGDYLHIFGTFSIVDLYNIVKNDLSIKEQKFFQWIFAEWGSYDCTVSHAMYYSKYSYRHVYFTSEIEWDMENNWMRNINRTAFTHFDSLCRQYLENLCQDLKQRGYEFFYDVSEEDITEWCDVNDFLFLENGKLFR